MTIDFLLLLILCSFNFIDIVIIAITVIISSNCLITCLTCKSQRPALQFASPPNQDAIAFRNDRDGRHGCHQMRPTEEGGGRMVERVGEVGRGVEVGVVVSGVVVMFGRHDAPE